MSGDDAITGRLIEANREAVDLYRGLLTDRPAGWARTHLLDRRLGHVLEPASRWRIGYAAASYDLVVGHLRRRGFEEDEIEASGLAVRTRRGRLIDVFRDRIMFPMLDPDGNPVGFVGRGKRGSAKYLNGRASAIYRKGELLYGLAEQRDDFDAGAVPVLVEGPTDVLAIDAIRGPAKAIRVGVATCGTSLTAEQVRVLRAVVTGDTLLLTTDNDAPGRKAAERGFAMLRLYFRTLLTPELPDGSDPADVLRRYGSDGLRAALRHTVPTTRRVIELRVGQWERWFDHLAGQLNAVTAVADLIRQLPPREVAAEIAWLAERVGLPSEIVTQRVIEAGSAESRVSGLDLPGVQPVELAGRRELGL